MEHTMSKHNVRLKNIFKNNLSNEVDIFELQNITKKFINSSISSDVYNSKINHVKKSFSSLKLDALGPIYYQNTTPFKRNWEQKPVYRKYHESESTFQYRKNVMADDLPEILYSRDIISLHTDKFEAFRSFIDNVVEDDEMLVNVDVDNIDKYNSKRKVNEPHYILSKKVFMRQHDNKLDYYFDENTPSIIEMKESTVILAHEEDIIDVGSKKSYMALYHYTKLNVVVEVIINPDESKIIPAITIYDANKKAVEVHCYYKNKYITPEIMELLKPNILVEDFKNIDYFSKNDMDYLDMIAI